MELVSRLSGRVIRVFLSRSARVELDARALVQKLAREEAAVRAVRIARLQSASPGTIDRLERSSRNARLFRDCALRSLRRELGLGEYPTQLEVADWGPAPVPPKQREVRLPVVADLGL